jgi:cobalt-zinc-cadmium efflux system membrane fusion protein
MHAWIENNGQTIDPKDVILHVWLQRLGAEKQLIHFYPNNDYLRGDTIIDEPHSFEIEVKAEYQNDKYRWNFSSFEGRTIISPDLAQLFDIQSSIAGPATIHETVNVYGQIITNPENVRNISARFDGVVRNVNTSIGSFVRKGNTLATIESNESLNLYSIKAPINGVVTQRYANSGEQTNACCLQ